MALADSWYLVGPLIAFAVVGVMSVVLRRAFGRDRLRPAPPLADDFGLLRVAALVDRLDVAEAVRRTLHQAGIRSTLSTGLDGLIKILVFPDDALRARRVLERDSSA
ncbi:hypothetical protein RB614_13890 [Phytohabitans sp. ZYX-F-186]|uniref:DUF2007 domain-containing protein n=1 Tax=Phytohabitans maris TaxID=3071409 RepID=A0ABU0ZEY8_9ACTN|nr:hypothetical protein [Phytohabitans sp. ZYX-F-186]MDQ7905608.1 hypothetical protein [Phytohabitans sp. ZYX-F-186]